MTTPLRALQRHLFELARRDPQRPLDTLFRHVTDWAVLEAAWKLVRRSAAANNGSLSPAAAHLLRSGKPAAQELLQQVAESLQSGRYQTGPVQRYSIPKPNRPGQFRPVAVLGLNDRIVHQAVKLVVEPIIEARLSRQSFAFRPGRSRFDQLHAVRRRVDSDTATITTAVVADIDSFFDRIDHGVLWNDIRRLTGDASLLKLIQQLVRQVGHGVRGFWRNRPVGVLQGSPLSPLLANWHLDRFDRAWTQEHDGDAPLFRYADDLCFLTRDDAHARAIRRTAAGLLKKLCRLELSAEKTLIATVDEGIPLLGMRLTRNPDRFTGAERCRIGIDPVRVRSAISELERAVAAFTTERPLGRQVEALNRTLRGWFEAWQFAVDSPEAFEAIDWQTHRLLRSRLRELLQLSHAAFEQRCLIRTATGHPAWQVDGVATVVLSALPRRFYRPRADRLPWNEPKPTAFGAPTNAAEYLAAIREPVAHSIMPPSETASATQIEVPREAQ